MKYSDTDTISKLKEQISGMEGLLKFSKVFPALFGGKEKLKELNDNLTQLKTQIIDFETLPDKFNSLFSEHGWIAYESLNFEFMRKQIQLEGSGNHEEAINGFFDYYSDETISFLLNRLYGLDEARIRIEFIQNAFVDYKAERYYAMIPVVIMMIDGIVNDIIGKGFHTEIEKFDVWDSITSIDNGINTIQSVFRKGRYKTRIEPINEPYRNGILHGVDLGYANKTVAVKTWNYLFMVVDWAKAKKSEEGRKAKFDKDNEPVKLKDVFEKIQRNDVVKKEVEKWKKNKYSEDYINSLNSNPDKAHPDSAEYICIQYFKYIKIKNYKELSALFWDNYFYSTTSRIQQIKNDYKDTIYNDVVITGIVDEAPVIKEILIKANEKNLTMRLIYQANKDDIALPVLENGNWRIVGVREV